MFQARNRPCGSNRILAFSLIVAWSQLIQERAVEAVGEKYKRSRTLWPHKTGCRTYPIWTSGPIRCGWGHSEICSLYLSWSFKLSVGRPSIYLWCLPPIVFLFLMRPEVRSSAITFPFLVVKQITVYGRAAFWAVNIMWTLERPERITMTSPCADRCAVILFLLDQACINYFSVSHRRLWVFIISPEWSNEPQMHNRGGSLSWSDYNLCVRETTTLKIHQMTRFASSGGWRAWGSGSRQNRRKLSFSCVHHQRHSDSKQVENPKISSFFK